MIGVGEMGIGNTTTSSAVLCALTGIDAGLAVGKGAGLTNEGFDKKKRIIMDAIKAHRPDPNDPIDVISKVGDSTSPPWREYISERLTAGCRWS